MTLSPGTHNVRIAGVLHHPIGDEGCTVSATLLHKNSSDGDEEGLVETRWRRLHELIGAFRVSHVRGAF
jgi:hypothetical protein